MFLDNEYLDHVFATKPEPLGVMAHIRIEGNTLRLLDVAVYCGAGTTRVRLGVGVLKRLLGQVEALAREAGYEYLVITGERLTGANPGRVVMLRRRLR